MARHLSAVFEMGVDSLCEVGEETSALSALDSPFLICLVFFDLQARDCLLL